MVTPTFRGCRWWNYKSAMLSASSRSLVFFTPT
jgi:hypothetical protein